VTFTWNQGGNFDIASQTFAPTTANGIMFASSGSYFYDTPFAHSHGQDINFTINATIDGVSRDIYTQLLTNGAAQQIVDLGKISFTKGVVTSIGFGCDACSGYTYHGFGYSGETTFTLSAVPEPASWALLVTGFVVVGVAARRRRFATAAA